MGDTPTSVTLKKHQQLGFKTQKAALDALRAILKTSPECAPLDGANLDLVVRAVLLHEDFLQICRPGVDAIWVAHNAQFPNQPANRAFHLRRTDGTVTNFSYSACVVERNPGTRLSTACRQAVDYQISAWRRARLHPSACQACAAAFTAPPHVDHWSVPFRQIVDDWLESEGLRARDVAFQPKRDADCSLRFADAALCERWTFFHQQLINAPQGLRLLCASCNLSRVP